MAGLSFCASSAFPISGAETLPRNEERSAASSYLPEAFSADPERLARFQREAEVLASLNHPNIAAIYGLEEADDTRALVLELVEGPTLADRIAKGPIPLDEALPIAKQIAEALEAAHEAGVIHRDLKPANIKVKDDGTVKVLDFGLAKALDPSPDGDPSQSPTLTAAATQMGVIMGTAAYMSPEQARGKPTDRRTDIWAFGSVLFEMLTGKRAFEGDDVSVTLANVINQHPDWNCLPDGVSSSLQTYLRRCFEKDPTKRVQSIGDMRLAIEGAFELADAPQPMSPLDPYPTGWRGALPWLGGVALAGGIALAAWTLTRPVPAEVPSVARSSIVMSPGVLAGDPLHYLVALSPDGTRLAYAGRDQLYLREMHQLEAVAIRGTEGATEPFFSPNGQWIGFWADGQLKKVSVNGGLPVALCETDAPFGASWNADGTILFHVAFTGVLQVSADGGRPEVLIPVEEGEVAMVRPQLLPGGEWVLFYSFPDRHIAIQSLVTAERKVLVEDGNGAWYLPTGHLVYVVDGTLLAVRFDLERRAVLGVPVPLAEGVRQSAAVAQIAYADDGTMVYQSGDTSPVARPRSRTLVWVDRNGNEEPLGLEPRPYASVQLSPEGKRVVAGLFSEENTGVWAHDLERGTATRLTFTEATDFDPIWTRDGDGVVFASRRDGSALNLYSARADGTGDVLRLTTSPNSQEPSSFSPDGQTLVFEESFADSTDVGSISMNGEPVVEWLLSSESSEEKAALSPDGRWLAYVSDESGRPEVYVRPFPTVNETRWPVSTGGGTGPVWGSHGQELFYIQRGREPNTATMMAAGYETNPTFGSGRPYELFEGPYVSAFAAEMAGAAAAGNGAKWFDVSPDGQRFLMIRQAVADIGSAAEPTLVLVQHWFEELKRLVPTP